MHESLNNDQLYEPSAFVNYEEFIPRFEASPDTKRFIEQYEKTLSRLQEGSTKAETKNTNFEEIAVCYHNIASAYLYQGNSKMSGKFYNKALEVYNEKCDLNAATIYHNLGWMYIEFEQPQRALQFCQNSLEIRKKCLGDIIHPDIAISYDNLGTVYFEQDQYKKALIFKERALNMRKELYKDNPHSFLAESYSNVGLTLKCLNRYKEALEALRNAVYIEGQLHGENQDVAFYMTNQAFIHFDIGEDYEAGQLSNRALRIYSKLNIRTPHTGMAHESLADIQNQGNDLETCRQNLVKAYRLHLNSGEKEITRARLVSLDIQAIEKKLSLTCNKYL